MSAKHSEPTNRQDPMSVRDAKELRRMASEFRADGMMATASLLYRVAERMGEVDALWRIVGQYKMALGGLLKAPSLLATALRDLRDECLAMQPELADDEVWGPLLAAADEALKVNDLAEGRAPKRP